MRDGYSRWNVYLRLTMALGLATIAVHLAEEAKAFAADKPIVVLDTSMGAITIELEPEKAPTTVTNFLGYVDRGFYDNTIFHRVIEGFMIQGGGLDDKMNEKPTKAAIKNEADNGLSNVKGTIAMAREDAPNTATSQFFINTVDNSRGLDPGRRSIAGYCVFGKVIEGLDVAEAISRVKTGRRRGAGDVPVTPVYIKSAKRKAK